MKALPTYPAYKPTAIPWLPQVPEHWEVKPGLAHLRFKQVKNTGMVEKRVLSLSYGRIVIKPQEKLTGLVPESFETYQIVDPGDIIIRATDLQNDRTSLRVGEVKDRGIITSAYLCLNVHDGMVPAFGYHLIHAYDLMKWLYGYGSGLRQNLDWGDFKRMPLIVPPLEEQHLIVRYLRALDAKVKRYIRTKRKLIAALQEQKQAIIQRAVTRGLDPNVKLKPSGVEWLGEVPEHWEVVRSRRLFSQRREKARAGDEQLTAAQNYGVIPQKMFMELEGRRVTQVVLNKEILKHVEVNDFVISMRSFQGGLELCSHSGCISSAYVPITPRAEVFPGFFKYLLKAPAYIKALASTSDLVRDGQAMRMENFAAIDLVLVPLQEQKRIAAYLDDHLRSLENAISRVRKEIALIQEYRTRSIADVVTGAVDVREAAKAMTDDQIIGRSDVQLMEEESLSLAEGEDEFKSE
jgi:type I restriction enzyme S subunit